MTPTVSVVVCAYTERRWADVLAAVESARTQSPAPEEILLVVDHNPGLAARLRAERLPGPVTVLDNVRQHGLSGARNTALAQVTGEVVVFLDDDASAPPGWLAALTAPYADDRVVAVGGAATPVWPDHRPGTLPAGPGDPPRGELDWVVGCTYAGQPTTLADVRNLMGCNMSFRREVFGRVGGFTEGIGRVGTVPLGCEETELCIRVRQDDPAARILFEPAALVRHRVSDDRLTWSYLRRRAYAEGVSKAAVSTVVGSADALSTERAYTSRIVPAGIARELAHGRVAGAFALVLAVLCAGFGYAAGTVRRRSLPTPGEAPPPVAVGEVDVAADDPVVELLPVRADAPPERARVLVRRGPAVLGEVDVPVRDGVVPPDELATALLDLPTPPPAPEFDPAAAPTVSVVIPSADRPDAAIRCARSVLATGYAKLEVLVVDNRPETASLRLFAADDERVRYVAEPVPGASIARNRGAAEATGEIVAFTDDDAVVDSNWLNALVAELADPTVDCVTGLVLPLALDTPAQRWFERWGGFGKGCDRRRLDPSGVDGPTSRDWAGRLALYPFAAGVFGSGNSMAWRAARYRELGGCDPLLGPGRPTASGEDLELFVRLVRSGGTLVYTPHAVVRHEHRRGMDELAGQLHSYGAGLFPMFAVHVGRRPTELLAVLRRLPGGVRHMLAGDSERNTGRGEAFPAELARAERRGMLAGPYRLVRTLLTAPRRSLGLPEPAAPEPLTGSRP